MNRKERRKLGLKKEPTYTLNQSQIDQIKKDAVDEALVLMLGLPVMVLHDNYPQLMKKAGREERFTDLMIELYESVEKGNITLEDVKKCLEEKCGIVIVERMARRC